MATVQSLKKKLQVINSTKKLTRAMKTSSTVKYSKLSDIYSDYGNYARQCEHLYQSYRQEFNSLFTFADVNAPACFIMMSSDKGMCGSFNSELLTYAEKTLEKEENEPVVFLCGLKAKDYFDKKHIAYCGCFDSGDIPTIDNAEEIFSRVRTLINEGEISSVKIIYPEYLNMMRQKPACCELFCSDSCTSSAEPPLFFPDKQTVIGNSAESIITSIIYKKRLETALGAQAATLTTMRSAYDTACEYSEQLEAQINRLRQSQVTADVIETSAEFSMETEE